MSDDLLDSDLREMIAHAEHIASADSPLARGLRELLRRRDQDDCGWLGDDGCGLCRVCLQRELDARNAAQRAQENQVDPVRKRTEDIAKWLRDKQRERETLADKCVKSFDGRAYGLENQIRCQAAELGVLADELLAKFGT